MKVHLTFEGALIDADRVDQTLASASNTVATASGGMAQVDCVTLFESVLGMEDHIASKIRKWMSQLSITSVAINNTKGDCVRDIVFAVAIHVELRRFFLVAQRDSPIPSLHSVLFSVYQKRTLQELELSCVRLPLPLLCEWSELGESSLRKLSLDHVAIGGMSYDPARGSFQLARIIQNNPHLESILINPENGRIEFHRVSRAIAPLHHLSSLTICHAAVEVTEDGPEDFFVDDNPCSRSLEKLGLIGCRLSELTARLLVESNRFTRLVEIDLSWNMGIGEFELAALRHKYREVKASNGEEWDNLENFSSSGDEDNFADGDDSSEHIESVESSTHGELNASAVDDSETVDVDISLMSLQTQPYDDPPN